ncbi:UNVERIFIED_CONTAM: hypothetical protein K2H54_067864 [Gekko kuhli]
MRAKLETLKQALREEETSEERKRFAVDLASEERFIYLLTTNLALRPEQGLSDNLSTHKHVENENLGAWGADEPRGGDRKVFGP